MLITLVFSNILFALDRVKADTNKIITITFNTAPTSANVTVAPLKYNKDFAFSYVFDDGLIAGYDVAFKYMNGGYSDYLGQYFGGLYFTDGAGNNVPFRGGYAFYARNSNYSDIHINTPSYITWNQLQETVDNGWNIFNHGYTSASVPADNPDYVYYVGDPGGHVTGALDYDYELSQLNVEMANHISLKNNNGDIIAPLQTTQVILPNGDANYIQPAFDGGFTSVYAQREDYFFDGSTSIAPLSTNVSSAISPNRHIMQRWFDYETRYLIGGEYPGGLFDRVDQLAANSAGADKYWGQSFTHQITTSSFSGDWNGGITFNSWKSLMDHIENNYGRFGSDNAWVAGPEEIYDYMMVKQNMSLSQNLVDNVLTIEIDTSNVPNDLKFYALSLLVNSDAIISSINYGSDFSYHTHNLTTGLINVDWGLNSYVGNDITRVESLVTAAESSKRQSDIDTARIYVDLLTTDPVSIKTDYITRLDAIEVPLRTWYIKVRGGVTNPDNCYSTNTATFSPSVYNWNNFYVGKGALVCGDLINLKDSDSQTSTLSLSNTAIFDGGLQSVATGDNSGIYPDSVLINSPSVYSAAETPAKIKIYGLEDVKTYNIKLFGYTSASLSTSYPTRNYTDYSVTGQSIQSLMVVGNISETVEFLDVLPVNGEIEVSVVSQNTAWGYGMLNAMEIKENILEAPSNLSYASPNVYTKDSAITSLTPTVTGLGITYSVSPALPT
ncbi:hypothetical protein JXE04_00175, partial [Patescibacteria group bacterium]|nr:hypothetical protein [Patescibacteria group bacterium]